MDDIYCCILMWWSFITGFPTVIDAADCLHIPPRHRPAEHEMNRRSSLRLAVTLCCINGHFSHCASMAGHDKPFYAFTLSVFSPAVLCSIPSSSNHISVFCVALLLSRYTFCSSRENTSFFSPHISTFTVYLICQNCLQHVCIITQLFTILLWLFYYFHIFHIAALCL